MSLIERPCRKLWLLPHSSPTFLTIPGEAPYKIKSGLGSTGLCIFCSMSCLLVVNVSLDLPSLDVPHKWNTWSFVTDFLHFASLLQVFKVHPCYDMYQYFIPFQCQIIFHGMERPQFVYPFTNWWTFHLLAIINNVTLNIHVQVFVWMYVFSFLGYTPVSRMTSVLKVSLCLLYSEQTESGQRQRILQ